MGRIEKRHMWKYRKDLWKGGPEKDLIKSLKRTGGRNNYGRLTCRGKGGGYGRRMYRIIDFCRAPGIYDVERIEYDPNRSCFIALICKENAPEEKSYILSPKGLAPGDKVQSSAGECPRGNGNSMPLQYIPTGSSIYNVELTPGKGGIISRSAGCFCVLLGKEEGYGIVKMKSGERRRILLQCRATMGIVSNEQHMHISLGKAGRARNNGRRPIVRGIAKNPVDHPHGGRANGGKHPRSPTGVLAKGGKTRNRKKKSNKLIIVRRARVR